MKCNVSFSQGVRYLGEVNMFFV